MKVLLKYNFNDLFPLLQKNLKSKFVFILLRTINANFRIKSHRWFHGLGVMTGGFKPLSPSSNLGGALETFFIIIKGLGILISEWKTKKAMPRPGIEPGTFRSSV